MSTPTPTPMVKIQHSRDGVWLHLQHARQYFSLNLSAHDTSRNVAFALAKDYPQDCVMYPVAASPQEAQSLQKMQQLAQSPQEAQPVPEPLELQTLRATLAMVADIAHSGGLTGHNDFSALTAIRGLTLRNWNPHGTLEEHRQRVQYAGHAAVRARSHS